MAVFAAIFLAILFIYTLVTLNFCLETKKAMVAFRIHLAAVLLGIVATLVILTVFYVKKSQLDSELSVLAGETFAFFAVPFFICAFISLIFSLVFYLSNKRTGAAVIFSYCAAELILLFAIMLSASAKYTEIDISLFARFLAISVSFICLIPPAVFLKRLSKQLENAEFVSARKAAFKAKKEPRNERKLIRETKKRIKNGGNKH